MKEIFLWPPVLHAARILLLVVLSGSSWVALLLLIRFLRPTHIKQLAAAPLPVVREVGASAEVLGQKLEGNAVLEPPAASIVEVDSGQERALREINSRLTKLEESHEQLREGTTRAIDLLRIESRQRREPPP